MKSAVQAYPVGPGAIYIRWGKTSCPDESSLIYKGRVGGSHFDQRGGAANHLRLPDDPEYTAAAQTKGLLTDIHRTEYQGDSLFNNAGLHNHNVPNSVCQADRRSTLIMIPTKVRCPDTS